MRWCYTCEKNVAGFYLTFIEVWKGEIGARTAYRGWERKSDAITDCQSRLLDSRKLKAERKFTIPNYKRAALKKAGVE